MSRRIEKCHICGGTGEIIVDNWLIEGMTEEELAREKEEALADIVEVVRCKDCIHSYFVKSCSKYECRKGCGTLKYSTDYCSYGERREE